ncbi:MAG: homoserine dehydrogenase [Oscillospiraceae bacterium]
MVKIAILGFGTVGTGVAEVLAKNGESIAHKLDNILELKYILDVAKRPESPFADLMITDFSVIEQDPEVCIVVETIGGVTAALDFTRRALKAGKSVVSSNKELVASYGYELLQLAHDHDVSYLFEASVGGGIPILRPLSQCLAANELTEICGILNGTTNYILTRMIHGGLSFAAALGEAQEKGYAERDPSADIEGHDACRKICILSAIAFGRHVYPSQVPTQGITEITLEDVAYAQAGGYKIKLLGRALRQEDGRVCCFVAPHLVAEDNPLAGVEDVFNAITVKGDAIGDVMFYGRGAGKLPTASAVVADVIDAAKHLHTKKYLDWGPGGDDVVASGEELKFRFYVRLEQGVPPAGSTPLTAEHQKASGCAFLTGAMTRAQLDAALVGQTALSVLRVLD